MDHDRVNYLHLPPSHEIFLYEDGVGILFHHSLARGLHQEGQLA